MMGPYSAPARWPILGLSPAPEAVTVPTLCAPTRAILAGLLSLALCGSAFADPVGVRAPGFGSPAASDLADPTCQAPSWASDLADYADRRRREAGAELRSLARDAERRNQAGWLAREGSPADVHRFASRLEAEDALDQLIERQETLSRVPSFRVESFGPVTRHLLERSRIELHWLERGRERELLVDDLGREVRERTAGDAPGFSHPDRP